MIETNGASCTERNVMDIGTVIRESDNVASMKLLGDNQKGLIKKLTKLAREVENEPCTIETTTGQDGNEKMVLTFSCAEEKLIFKMRARSLVA